MIFRNIIVVLCIASFAFADDKQDAIDQLVDGILGNVFKEKELNPMRLHEDYVEPVDERIGLIRVTGEIKIAHGELKGLSTMARTGHCKLETSPEGNMVVTISLKTNDQVVLEADVSGHLSGFPSLVAVPIEAHVHELVINTVMELGSDQHLHLKQFHVADIHDVEIRLQEGYHIRLAETVMDIISNSAVDLFNKQVKDVVDQVVKPILVEELKHIHI